MVKVFQQCSFYPVETSFHHQLQLMKELDFNSALLQELKINKYLPFFWSIVCKSNLESKGSSICVCLLVEVCDRYVQFADCYAQSRVITGDALDKKPERTG